MKSSVQTAPLNKESVEFYKEKGYYLHKKPVLSHDKFDALSVIFEEQYSAMGGKISAGDFDVPHFKDPRLFDFLMAPEVLDLVEQFIGPNIGLWSSHFICKEPFKGQRTPWHGDIGYWQGRFDSFDNIVTLWLAIDKATRENGCMGVVPGSHLGVSSEYQTIETDDAIFNLEVLREDVNEDDVVWFELDKNECSFHDSRIIHGANANTSNTRRCGYTMRYFSLNMVLNREHPHNINHKIYHCRGNNLGNNPLIYL